MLNKWTGEVIPEPRDESLPKVTQVQVIDLYWYGRIRSMSINMARLNEPLRLIDTGGIQRNLKAGTLLLTLNPLDKPGVVSSEEYLTLRERAEKAEKALEEIKRSLKMEELRRVKGIQDQLGGLNQ